MTNRKRKKLLYKELKLRLDKLRAIASFQVIDVSAYVKQNIELTFIYAPNGPRPTRITFPEVFKTPE